VLHLPQRWVWALVAKLWLRALLSRQVHFDSLCAEQLLPFVSGECDYGVK
jgi:hypothetical protein